MILSPWLGEDIQKALVLSLFFSQIQHIGRADEIDPRVKMLELWIRMCGVWRRLEGPVVNPTLVCEAMARVAKEGVVWDNFSWSLMDRVIALDPVVWVVEPSGS